MAQPENALARLVDFRGKPVGVGFLVDERHVLTCAHVVAGALGVYDAQTMRQMPTAPIRLDFPLGEGSHNSLVVAYTVCWRPFVPYQAGDIACLELEHAVNLQPLPLAVKDDLWQQSFRAFGVPAGYDSGVWSDGVLLGRNSQGYYQMQNLNPVGYRIQPGYSGSPIWVDALQAVVGMVTLADAAETVYAGFAIPALQLVDVMEQVVPSSVPGTTAPATLGTISDLAPDVRNRLWIQYSQRTAQSQTDLDDLLAAGLLALWYKNYDLALTYLETVCQRQPNAPYATYAAFIAHLAGKPPMALNRIDVARQYQQRLALAAQRAPSLHLYLLLGYLKDDYFRRHGLRVDPPSVTECIRAAMQIQPDLAEITALRYLVAQIDDHPVAKALIK